MFLEQPLLFAQSRFINSILLSAITLLLFALMRGQNSLRKIRMRFGSTCREINAKIQKLVRTSVADWWSTASICSSASLIPLAGLYFSMHHDVDCQW